MNVKRCTTALLGLLLFPACSHPGARPSPGAAAPAAAQPLFNGKDLSGWHTFLGIPGPAVEGVGISRNAEGKYTQPVGLDVDPKGVFSVVTIEGQPAIRISGEIWGALVTDAEYEDFHLSLEYKWGEKKWPPRDVGPRDSGILYHSVGPYGVANSEKAWMKSLECQVQEGDTGDFWSVAKLEADFTAEPFVDSENRSVLRYKPGGAPFVRYQNGTLSRVVKLANHEQAGWNKVEVVAVGAEIVHVVNGHVVLRLRNPRQPVDGALVPLRRGKLQLQSEGAEIFYRNVTVAPARQIPAAYAETSPPQ